MAGKGFQKGEGGRPKGVRNKLTATVKEAIIEAFNQAGGVEYLTRIANEDPKTFCALVGKVIPLQITGKDDGPVELKVKWEE